MALKPLEQGWIDMLKALSRAPTLEQPAPQVERLGPGTGSTMTSPLSSVASYKDQGPALRDPAFPMTGKGNSDGLLSIDEHVQPFGVDKRLTQNPATGRSFLEEPQVDANGQPVLRKGGPQQGTPKMVDAEGPRGDMTTVRTTRTTGDAKNVGDQQVIDDYESSKTAALKNKGSFDPYEDLGDAQKQAMSPQAAIERQLAAAKGPSGNVVDPSVTRESATVAVHGQEGTKSHYGKTGQAQEMANIVDGVDTDALVDNSKFGLAKGYLDPIMPTPKPGAAPTPSPPVAETTIAPKGPLPANATPPATEPVVTEPTPNVVPEPAGMAPTAATAAADGATSAESGVAASASGGMASAGILGGVIAGVVTLAGDVGKVSKGQMSVGDAAVDAGGKAVETGVLTTGGVAVAKQLAGTAAEAGGVVGGIVSAGLAAVDDIGKYRDGKMTGGEATADIGVKGGIGVAAGALGAMAASAAAGSELGLALGTVVPGAGNVIGFVAGAAIGATVGLVGNALASSETGQKIEAAVGHAIDAGVDAVKDAGHAIGAGVDAVEGAGHAIANFFSGDDD